MLVLHKKVLVSLPMLQLNFIYILLKNEINFMKWWICLRSPIFMESYCQFNHFAVDCCHPLPILVSNVIVPYHTFVGNFSILKTLNEPSSLNICSVSFSMLSMCRGRGFNNILLLRLIILGFTTYLCLINFVWSQYSKINLQKFCIGSLPIYLQNSVA